MEVTIVGLSYDRAVAELENWMSKWSGVELSELREHFFLLKDRDACTHLLAVSGGLDSVALGEGQILAQSEIGVSNGRRCQRIWETFEWIVQGGDCGWET